MRKFSIVNLTLIASIILFAGCGGESSSVEGTTNTSLEITSPTTNEQREPVVNDDNSISLIGALGKKEIQFQKISGVIKQQNAIVDAEFSNATGEFIYKESTTDISGNITFALRVSDPDGIEDISIYLPDIERTIVLCSQDCGSEFSENIIGYNPQLYGLSEGILRIELFVTDSAQNTAKLDAQSVNWRPISISGITATRENDKLSISWSGDAGLQRYNVYAATDHNLTSFNALTLEHGVQQLSIKETSVEIDDKDPQKDYYFLITGIDENGESGLSSPIKIASKFIPPNQPPNAFADIIEGDEDVIINSNILFNDTDPENSELALTAILQQPSNGTLTAQTNGEVTYTPNTNFNGNDSFTYQISDNENNSAQANVLIVIRKVNDAPVAVNDSFNLNIDNTFTSGSGALIANDYDIDGDFIFVTTTPVTDPLHGTLQLNSDGSFTYIEDDDFIGNDSFEYQLTDNKGGTSIGNVILLTSGQDIKPVAINDSFEINEDTTLVVVSTNSILNNDTDPNGFDLTLNTTLIKTTSHGQLNLSEDGTFTYIPDTNFYGLDDFKYEVVNTLGEKSQAFVSIIVKPIADIPTANNDSYQIDEDTILDISAEEGLLANDLNIDGAELTINQSPLVRPQQGSVLLNADGSFIYTPNINFQGLDTFTYQVINASNKTSTAQVNITVNAINNAPRAINDNVQTNSETSLEIYVVSNDMDIDGDDLKLISASISAEFGFVTFNTSSNSILYSPLPTFGGVATINYTISDPLGLESSATVLVSVSLNSSLNSDPFAGNDLFTLNEDSQLIADTLLDNDTDSDGGTLSVLTTPLIDVSNGVLLLSSNGAFNYTPSTNFNGTDFFTYRITDNQGGFNSAQVTLNISPINDAPVANSDYYSMLENTNLTVMGNDFNTLLSNDTDSDGDALTINVSASSNTSSGTLLIESDGKFSYTPDDNFFGIDTFYYQLEDGNGGSASGSVAINVLNTNTAPKAITDNYSMFKGEVLNALSVLNNDIDDDGDSLTVDTSFSSSPSNGVVSFSNDGTFVYTPNTDFVGVDNFTYTVDDGNGKQDEGLVNITITTDPIIHGNPLAITDYYNINQNTVLSGENLLGNDMSDQTNSSDTSLLTVTTTPYVAPIHGILILESNGNFTYTPDNDFSGSDSFEYEIRNIYNNTSTAIVTINIAFVNTPPEAVGDTYITTENNTLNASSVLSNDIDTDQLRVDTTLISYPSNGSVSMSDDGTFIFIPDTDFVGEVSFVYRIYDTYGQYDDATVNLIVESGSSSFGTPKAVNDYYFVSANQPITVTTMLDNDESGDILNIIPLTVTTPAIRDVMYGTLILQSNGNFIYTPNVNFSGEDFFIYRITNVYGNKSTGKVTLVVD